MIYLLFYWDLLISLIYLCITIIFYLFNIYFFYTINSNIKEQYHNIYILKVLTQ